MEKKQKLLFFWLRQLLRSFFASDKQEHQLHHNKVDEYDSKDVNEEASLLEKAHHLDELIRLQNETADLLDENVRLRKENARLREELADLRSRRYGFRGGLDDLKRRIDKRDTDRKEAVRYREETERLRARSVQYREETTRLQRDRQEIWFVIIVDILSRLMTFL